MRRAAAALVAATLAAGGCGGGDEAHATRAEASLAFALQAHRMATETASAAAAFVRRSTEPHEVALRAAGLQADGADLDERIRDEVPFGTPARAPLLAAAEGTVEAARRLAGLQRDPVPASRTALTDALSGVEDHLRAVAAGLRGAVPAASGDDLATLEQPLPPVSG